MFFLHLSLLFSEYASVYVRRCGYLVVCLRACLPCVYPCHFLNTVTQLTSILSLIHSYSVIHSLISWLLHSLY